MHELADKRTRSSKTFDLGNGKKMLRVGRSPLHYAEHGKLLDIDTTPKASGNLYEVTEAPYRLKLDPKRPAYLYTNEAGKWVEVELVEIDGAPVKPAAPIIEGGLLKWGNIAPDTDIVISPLRHGCQTLAFLHSDKAPKKWHWRVRGDATLLLPPTGRDAAGKMLEILSSSEGEFLDITWTGRAASRRMLRQLGTAAWNTTVRYPVIIDPTVNEVIGVGADDVYSAWYGSGATFSNFDSAGTYGLAGRFDALRWYAGVRFQTIDIPQGATIDSATLTIQVVNAGGTPNLDVYGDDVDDAAAWATPGSRVKDITKTTASTNVTNPGTGPEAIDIAGIVQELVNRAGWVANNDMRFGFFNAATAGNNYVVVAALEHATETEAQLDITYTAAGGSVGAATGTSAVAAVGAPTFKGVGAVTGTVSVTAASLASKESAAATSGTVAVAGVGIASTDGVGSVAGTAVVAAVGQATKRALAAVTGTVDVAGVGAATFKGTGAATGMADVTAASNATKSSAGATEGTAAVAAVSQATKLATFTESGTATVAGIGAATFSATATAAGTADVTALSNAEKRSPGVATGSVDVAAVSNAEKRSPGTTTGTADVVALAGSIAAVSGASAAVAASGAALKASAGAVSENGSNVVAISDYQVAIAIPTVLSTVAAPGTVTLTTVTSPGTVTLTDVTTPSSVTLAEVAFIPADEAA